MLHGLCGIADLSRYMCPCAMPRTRTCRVLPARRTTNRQKGNAMNCNCILEQSNAAAEIDWRRFPKVDGIMVGTTDCWLRRLRRHGALSIDRSGFANPRRAVRQLAWACPLRREFGRAGSDNDVRQAHGGAMGHADGLAAQPGQVRLAASAQTSAPPTRAEIQSAPGANPFFKRASVVEAVLENEIGSTDRVENVGIAALATYIEIALRIFTVADRTNAWRPGERFITPGY